MDQKTFFMKIWEKEAPATRKVLSRIPEGSDYRPDPKSRTAREIAWLLVQEEVALGEGLAKGVIEWAEKPAPATMAEVLALYDRRHPDVTATLQALPPARWEQPVGFLWGGQEVMREPAFEMAWGFLLDAIHHRGQLSTYLRPMGSTVPQIYGPSADEPM
jgi:uncharacterized damage-inducible protein DinB